MALYVVTQGMYPDSDSNHSYAASVVLLVLPTISARRTLHIYIEQEACRMFNFKHSSTVVDKPHGQNSWGKKLLQAGATGSDPFSPQPKKSLQPP